MGFKTMKFREKYEKLVSDNKLLTQKLIEMNSKLVISEQKYLSIESAFELSQKLVQHLKTENQLLRSSAPDIFSLSIPLGPPLEPPLCTTLAITDGTETGEPSNVATNQSQSDNNPNSDLCKSDLIAIQYEKEIKEFREEYDLLCSLPLDCVLIKYEDQLNANSHLSGASESEYECDEQMDVDFDAMSSRISETSEMKTQLKCKLCGKKFPEVTAFREHKKLHQSSDGKQFRCAEDFCGHQFDTKHELKRHLKSIHKNSHKSTKFTSLKTKFQMNQNKRLFECNQCKEEFPSIQSLRVHQKSVHNIVSTFKCKFSGCDQKFEKSSELRAHEEVHRKQKSTIEFKQTPTKIPILPETNGASEPTPPTVPKPARPFPCKFEGCNASYVNKTSLKKHEEKCHPNGMIPVISPMQTTDTTIAAVAPVAPAQDLGNRLELLNLFFSAQQKHAQL